MESDNYVFLSAASRDKELVNELINWVEQHEIRVWYANKDATPGSDFQIEIDDALLRQGVERMMEACSVIFIPEFETNPLRQQQVLSILAEHGPLKRIPALFLAEYEMSNTSFNTAVKELVRKGNVKLDSQGRYFIMDPVYKKWLNRAI